MCLKQKVAPGPAMSLALTQASNSHVAIFLNEFREDCGKGVINAWLTYRCIYRQFMPCDEVALFSPVYVKRWVDMYVKARGRLQLLFLRQCCYIVVLRQALQLT